MEGSYNRSRTSYKLDLKEMGKEINEILTFFSFCFLFSFPFMGERTWRNGGWDVFVGMEREFEKLETTEMGFCKSSIWRRGLSGSVLL